ncbi:unnamed protein product [Bursaphelenchus okinawaensis]|uniref:PAX-interacting protein 1 n=1 Tax=Bursaphelenchus okinawaensis TaxID=465554 RepID=A0A811KUV4_9BILA|nr:unnamed protein product [Bursaphelenchus okinawaensis]CAG9112671.1 unnamed protein product [Bursaphelenchus okinawaensis]
MDPPLSPLGNLDPHMLRDMVVDKQGVPPGSHLTNSSMAQHWSPAHISQNTSSPASEESPRSQQRLSTGSNTDINSPFQNRSSSQQPQQFDFNTPRTPMFPGPSNSPTKPVPNQQHLMSPVGQSPQQPQSQISQHMPSSPFPRTSSAASSNACPSPYPQSSQVTNQQYQAQMYNSGYPTPRMPYPNGQPGYSNYGQMNQQWQGQNMHPAYMNQPRMMGTSIQRPIRYPTGYPQQGVPQQQFMYQQPRPVRQQYPQGNGSNPQTPGAVPQSPSQGNYPYNNQTAVNQSQNHYYMQQQQRLQHQGNRPESPSVIRPYMQPVPVGGSAQGMGMPMTPMNGQSMNPHVRYVSNGMPANTPIQYSNNMPQTSQGQMGHNMVQSPDMNPQGQAPCQQIIRQPMPPQQSMYPSSVPVHSNMPMPGTNALMHVGQQGMIRVGQPVRSSAFYDFDPHWQHRVCNTETFLGGCVFWSDPDLLLEPNEIQNQLRYYGGEFETGLTPSMAVTHCVFESMTDKARDFIKKTRTVRFVTPAYLSDVIARKRMSPPFKASHLPSAWGVNNKEQYPGHNKVFAAEGFDDNEIEMIKILCKGVGARFNSCINSNHAALIAKCEGGMKFTKAQEWEIPTVNLLWLVKLYFGNSQIIAEMRHPENSAGIPGTGEITGPIALEKICDNAGNLLASWKVPIPVNEVTLQKAMELRAQTERDVTCFPHHKIRLYTEAPTEEQITQAVEVLHRDGKLPNVRVYVDRLPSEMVESLGRRVRFLGGQVTSSIVDCTHFATPDLKRTVELCEALGLGREIVDVSWIDHSFSCLKFVDSFDFHVRDYENEAKYGFNVMNTLFRARTRPVFEDVTFHISPNVQPSREILQRLIQSAGGIVEEHKPTYKKIYQAIKYDKTFIVVVNDSDACDYEYLWEKKIPLFNEEFVCMAIIRHDFDISANYRLNPPDEPHKESNEFAIRSDRVKVA